jgi:hypothetical protein
VISIIIVAAPNILFNTNKYNHYKFRRKSFYETITLKDKIYKILGKVFFLIIGVLIFVFLILSYLKDLPGLITGNLIYITGEVTDIQTRSKDPSQYVFIEGKEVEFFFDSGAEIYKNYKIGYLPNTSRGIYIVQLGSNSTANERKLGFPFKSIFQYIGITIAFFSAMALLYYAGYKLRYKLLFLSCVIFYPTGIYFLIKYGLASWIWFSVNNQAFVALITGFISLIILRLLILLIRYTLKEEDDILFVAQIIAAGHIFGAIYLIQDWIRVIT